MFPKKHLFEGEEIVLERRPHPMTMFLPIIAMIACGAAAIVLGIVIDLAGNINRAATWVPVALLVLSTLWFLKRWIVWRTTHFVLTTDRLIRRSGVISKKGKEIPLERINDISSSQSLWERITHSGDLLVESGGENGQERFANLRNPFEVQNQLYRQMERTQNRDLDRVAGRKQLSIPEQIEKLDQLRQQGVVTQAEFDAKKIQLLDQM
jgi:uncharacterized membrane protein YdbT with pleckstrin-like domain